MYGLCGGLDVKVEVETLVHAWLLEMGTGDCHGA